MADDRYAWQKLAAEIRSDITSGGLAIGDLLPSVRALMKSSGKSDNTITRAYAVLAEEGLVRAEPGIGVRVIASLPDPPRSTSDQLAELRGRIAAQEEITAQQEARIRALENPDN